MLSVSTVPDSVISEIAEAVLLLSESETADWLPVVGEDVFGAFEDAVEVVFDVVCVLDEVAACQGESF